MSVLQMPSAILMSRLKVYDTPSIDGQIGGTPHLHLLCTEMYFVLEGSGAVEIIDKAGFSRVELAKNDALLFSAGTLHRLINPQRDLEILVIMQNSGLPERGDNVVTFADEHFASQDAYDSAMRVNNIEDEVRTRFLGEWAKSHGIKLEGEALALATVGDRGWTLPIPIVKSGQGWQFDTLAGAEEMRIRRIGRNELAVMQVMLAIYDAQTEYAEQDRDGDGVREYAGKFESAPGKQDGLYWPAVGGTEPSPLGSAIAMARASGGSKSTGYYGYRYKLLGGQGKHASGGALDFVIRGHQIGGFAVVAWPVKYGDTGVMTFMVSHDGKLYEKDLGMQTESKAKAMTRFDPEASWRKVEPGS